MIVAIVISAEQQGPLVKHADYWPMVTHTGANWHNQRLIQETGVVNYVLQGVTLSEGKPRSA